MTEGGIRNGFLIGDSTGMGKGRQAAAIIWDNWLHGRRKAVWISSSADLFDDASRDLAGIGATVLCDKLRRLPQDPRDNIPGEEGIIFCSYSLLAREARASRLLAWLGEGFQGIVAFDEAHKAKNSKLGTGVATRTGECVQNLQERLPSARIVYLSATGATQVGNMAYLSRLGLWGKGTHFYSFEYFRQEMEDAGISGREMISLHLKATGAYVARLISFRGVEFSLHSHDLSPEERANYDEAAALWADIYTHASKSAFSGAYWGSHQRFFRMLLTSYKVPLLLDRVKGGLREGKSVVIGLTSTGAAYAEGQEGGGMQVKPGEAVDGGEGQLGTVSTSSTDMVPAPRPSRGWPRSDTPASLEAAEATEEAPREVLVRTIEAMMSGEDEAKKGSFIARALGLSLPGNPLDEVLRCTRCIDDDTEGDTQGRGKVEVVELTGRKGIDSTTRVRDIDRFQRGEARVAVISGAASAGISLHASRDAANPAPRVHITLELSWSAESQLQFFGRTHRSGQLSPPRYEILCTSVPGEQRFVSAVASRLGKLGALMQGERRAAGQGLLRVLGSLDSREGADALEHLYGCLGGSERGGRFDHYKHGVYATNSKVLPKEKRPKAKEALGLLLLGTKPGFPEYFGSLIPESMERNVAQFLNRLLGLSIENQETLFSFYQEILSNPSLGESAVGHGGAIKHASDPEVSCLLSPPRVGGDTAAVVRGSRRVSGAGGLSGYVYTIDVMPGTRGSSAAIWRESSAEPSIRVLAGSILSLWPRLVQLVGESSPSSPSRKGRPAEQAGHMGFRLVFAPLSPTGRQPFPQDVIAGVRLPPGVTEDDFSTPEGRRKELFDVSPRILGGGIPTGGDIPPKDGKPVAVQPVVKLVLPSAVDAFDEWVDNEPQRLKEDEEKAPAPGKKGGFKKSSMRGKRKREDETETPKAETPKEDPPKAEIISTTGDSSSILAAKQVPFLVLAEVERRIKVSSSLPPLLTSLAAARGRPLIELAGDFAKSASNDLSGATKAAIEWLLREHFRRVLASMLSKDALLSLIVRGCGGIPSSILQGHGLHPPGKGHQQEEWKVHADPQISWANAKARQRLPTKAPESPEFRAEVAGWLRRALKERLLPALLPAQ